MIEFRTMVEADIPDGLALCRSAGWNQVKSDWQLFLQLSPQGCRVAIDESGNVIGTVATVNYENRFAWVGMVLVDPGKKKQGIGTQLLQESLRILSNVETIKLDATPAGREIYLKLHFTDEYVLSRMMVSDLHLTEHSGAAQMNDNDLVAILQYDEEIFGARREELLKSTRKNAPQLAFVSRDEKIIGYCFGRNGYNYTQIGPVVANDIETAKKLTVAALKNISGPVIMDTHDNSAFQRWIRALGFTEQRKLIRMYRGLNKYPGLPQKQFAILGPEFG
jgi:hypothetical protein